MRPHFETDFILFKFTFVFEPIARKSIKENNICSTQRHDRLLYTADVLKGTTRYFITANNCMTMDGLTFLMNIL